VFDHLIESKRKPEYKKGLGTGFFSLIIHGGIIAGALYGTLKPESGDDTGQLDTMTMVP
jgi:hypothetical protein